MIEPALLVRFTVPNSLPSYCWLTFTYPWSAHTRPFLPTTTAPSTNILENLIVISRDLHSLSCPQHG